MEEPTPNEPPRAHWHLKKEIQLTHVLTTLGMVLSVVIYAQQIEKRISRLEDRQIENTNAQRERDLAQDEDRREKVGEIRNQLGRIEGKLDRLIESRIEKH